MTIDAGVFAQKFVARILIMGELQSFLFETDDGVASVAGLGELPEMDVLVTVGAKSRKGSVANGLGLTRWESALLETVALVAVEGGVLPIQPVAGFVVVEERFVETFNEVTA